MHMNFRHELAHAVDELHATNKNMIKLARERWRSSDQLYTSAGGWKYNKGGWAREYMGVVHEGNLKRGEIHSCLNELFTRFTIGEASPLLTEQFSINKESIAHWVAWMNGAYIP